MTLKSLTATTHVERFQGVRVMYCRSDRLRIDSSNYVLLHAQRVGVVYPIHRPLTDAVACAVSVRPGHCAIPEIRDRSWQLESTNKQTF